MSEACFPPRPPARAPWAGRSPRPRVCQAQPTCARRASTARSASRGPEPVSVVVRLAPGRKPCVSQWSEGGRRWFLRRRCLLIFASRVRDSSRSALAPVAVALRRSQGSRIASIELARRDAATRSIGECADVDATGRLDLCALQICSTRAGFGRLPPCSLAADAVLAPSARRARCFAPA